VAGIALFLASDLSAYTSGAIIPADGGLAVYRWGLEGQPEVAIRT